MVVRLDVLVAPLVLLYGDSIKDDAIGVKVIHAVTVLVILVFNKV